jgi:hypothetical protein
MKKKYQLIEVIICWGVAGILVGQLERGNKQYSILGPVSGNGGSHRIAEKNAQAALNKQTHQSCFFARFCNATRVCMLRCFLHGALNSHALRYVRNEK